MRQGMRLRRGLIAVLLIALPVVMLAGGWRLGGVSALEDDLIYYLPVRQYIGERLRAGELPLWNPLVAMGTSIAADPQAGLWYPPTILFATLPPLWAYPVTLVLHFALAGGGMYRFLRAGRHDWRAALLGAIAFQFCGFLVAHRAHLTILEATAWLPWLFYAWRRLADSGAYRHLAVAGILFGLQMLVQHIQVTIIGGTLLTAYVAVVLWPRRQALAWLYPIGMTIGVMLSGIQLIPTLFQFAGSVRSAPAYHLFVENSWWPGSAVLLLFPMLFGARTPHTWDQPWWGMSHFCEQAAYASMTVLVLAMASLMLMRRRPNGGPARWDCEVVFWWAALAVALVVALGQYMPVSEWLFHVPLYRSLRVPARWMLVWSFALPVLAATAASAVMGGGHEGRRAGRAVRRIVVGFLPAVVGLCLAALVIMRWRQADLMQRFADPWFDGFWAGLLAAIRPDNPALWLPIVYVVVTAIALTAWTYRPAGRRLAVVCVVLLVDLASVAGFVDVDTRVYRRGDLTSPPPLAEAIRKSDPQPGERLLVPRFTASYERPLEVLWPQTNVRYGIAVFNGYGPLWPAGHRLLFRFMPWGSSEAMQWILSEPALCRAMGVRFVAVRSEQERELLATAGWPWTSAASTQPIDETAGLQLIRAGEDVLWPVRIEERGLYELSLEVEAGRDTASRSFVRLEMPTAEGIGPTFSIEPIDLSIGRRRMRFLIRCDVALGPAFVRVKSERGWSLMAGRACFRRVADALAASTAPADGSLGPFVHRADLPGGVSLYELPGGRPLVGWATRATAVADLAAAVDVLQNRTAEVGLPDGVVVEGRTLPVGGAGPVAVHRPRSSEVWIKAAPPADGLLVFNESYDPGWRAFIDGRQVRGYRVNGVVQGVVFPAGQHDVRFVYHPAGLRAGTCWTAAGILALLAGAWATNRARTM